MVNTQAILRNDLFLNALRAAGGSLISSTLQDQFNLCDLDLERQQRNVNAFVLIASTVKTKGHPKVARMTETIKKQAREYKAAMSRYNRAELGEEWKQALNARTIYDALITQCYELCVAAGPGVIPAPPWRELLVYMLTDCRKVREEKLRWELEQGNYRSILTQYENLQHFFSVAHRFDVSSAPEDKQDPIRQQVRRIEALAKPYFASFKKWRRSKEHVWSEDVARLCQVHAESVTAVREFFILAYPSMDQRFVDRFGLEE
jgi:hypothetical protein